MVFIIRLMIPGRVTNSTRNMLSLIVILVSTTTFLFLVILGEPMQVASPITFVCGEVAQPTITMEVRNIPTDDNYQDLCAGSFYGRKQTIAMIKR